LSALPQPHNDMTTTIQQQNFILLQFLFSGVSEHNPFCPQIILEIDSRSLKAAISRF
jgi:hypothetical protein